MSCPFGSYAYGALENRSTRSTGGVRRKAWTASPPSSITTCSPHIEHRTTDTGSPFVRLVATGTGIRVVSDLLGHATPSFTMSVYTHASDKDAVAAVTEAERLLGG